MNVIVIKSMLENMAFDVYTCVEAPAQISDPTNQA